VSVDEGGYTLSRAVLACISEDVVRYFGGNNEERRIRLGILEPQVRLPCLVWTKYSYFVFNVDL
jgi:hypothetical protein